MGGTFSPSVLNIFMAHWEVKVIFNNNKPELIIWNRIIDDAFMVWRHTEEYTYSFLASLNEISLGIKWSWGDVIFLDLTIYT